MRKHGVLAVCGVERVERLFHLALSHLPRVCHREHVPAKRLSGTATPRKKRSVYPLAALHAPSPMTVSFTSCAVTFMASGRMSMPASRTMRRMPG